MISIMIDNRSTLNYCGNFVTVIIIYINLTLLKTRAVYFLFSGERAALSNVSSYLPMFNSSSPDTESGFAFFIRSTTRLDTKILETT